MFSSLRAKINDARWYIRARILKGTRIMPKSSRGKLNGDIVSASFAFSRSIEIMSTVFAGRL